MLSFNPYFSKFIIWLTPDSHKGLFMNMSSVITLVGNQRIIWVLGIKPKLTTCKATALFTVLSLRYHVNTHRIYPWVKCYICRMLIFQYLYQNILFGGSLSH